MEDTEPITKNSRMEILIPIGLVVAYVVLNKWVLPAFGVPT